MNAETLKKLLADAETQEAAQTLAAVCKIVGVGVATAQSVDRSADTATRRGVVAWILADRLGWSHAKVAAQLNRTPRQIRRMVRKNRG